MNPQQATNSIDRRILIAWLLSCLAIVVVNAMTITLDPLIFQDEVQIVDYGRTALDPDTSWGINWSVEDDSARLTTAWAGTFLQELAYRLTAPSDAGPRLVCLGSAVLASFCLLGWLLSRETPRLVALVLSLALLVDPVFSDNFRVGRVDGWAFAACLGACWLLRSARRRAGHHSLVESRALGAGLLAGASPFLWLNAPLLFPLVLLELLGLIRARMGTSDLPWTGVAFRYGLHFALGGVISVLLFLIPAFMAWDVYWHGLVQGIETQAHAAVIQNSIAGLLAVHDPILLIVTIIALLFYRDWGLLIAMAVAAVMMKFSMVYLPRVMYLLPYLLALIASSATRIGVTTATTRLSQRALRLALALLIVCNIGVTLVLRTTDALLRWPANDPSQLLSQLQRVIGSGPHRVLVEEWTGYFAARDLGWHFYRSAMPVNTPDYVAFLKTMDYLVLREKPVRDTTFKLLEEAGFELEETIHFEESDARGLVLGNLQYTIPTESYVPISVYRNSHANQHSGMRGK